MDMDFSTIPVDLVIHLVNICVLFVLLKLLVFKPVKRFMDARALRVAGELENAQKTQTEARLALEEYTAACKSVEAKSLEMISSAETQARARAKSIIEEAQEELALKAAEANKRLEDQRRAAMEDLKEQIAQTSVCLAGSILEREINSEDNQKVVTAFFEKVG